MRSRLFDCQCTLFFLEIPASAGAVQMENRQSFFLLFFGVRSVQCTIAMKFFSATISIAVCKCHFQAHTLISFHSISICRIFRHLFLFPHAFFYSSFINNSFAIFAHVYIYFYTLLNLIQSGQRSTAHMVHKCEKFQQWKKR